MLAAVSCKGPAGGGSDASPADTTDASPPSAPRRLEGTFTDQTESLGALPFQLHPGDMTMAEPEHCVGLFTDLDGDGFEELVVTPTRVETGPFEGRRPHAWRLDRASGRWNALGPLPGNGPSPVLAATDLDGDGHTDLVLSVRRGMVAWGRAGGGFDAPEDLLEEDPTANFALGQLALDDLDDDGWTDLLLGNRYCNDTAPMLVALLRVGPRRFQSSTMAFPRTRGSSPYAVHAWRVGDAPRTVVALGQGCGEPSPVFFRQATPAPGASAPPRFEVTDPIPRDAYFNRFGGSPRTLSEYVPMGAALTDLDGDGRADLFIALDPFHAFFLDRPGGVFADRTEESEMAVLMTPRGTRMIPWGVASLDLDRDGLEDLVIAHGNDPAAWHSRSALIGPQRATVHLARGNGAFSDATDGSGLGREGQWRGIAVGDPDHDGDPDLVVGGQGEGPRLYRNDLTTPTPGASLLLRGTVSNLQGLGAEVSVRLPSGRVFHAWAGAWASPDVVSEPVLFVPLASQGATAVELRWPSGLRQTITDLRPSSHRVVAEPRVVALDPPSRHAPADGRSTVTVRVTPRGPDGAPTDAPVTVTLDGAGSLSQPAARRGEAWEATLRSPSSPGSAVVTVRIGEAPLRVRPRVWWD